MWQRLKRPWVLWRRLDAGGVEVSLEWRNRALLPALLLLSLLEAVFPSRAWLTLLLATVTVTLVAVFWAWQLAKGLRTERTLRFALVQVGDLLEERFVITNLSLLPAIWVQVTDHGTVPGYEADTVRSVGPASQHRWVARGECLQRGEYKLGPWETVAADPFHFFTVVQRNPKVDTVLVYPSVARRLPFALPQGRSSGWAHASQKSFEPTVNVGGVRVYQPGDPRHHVHWPTTARRGQLHTKEFDQEAGGDVWLIVDLDCRVHVGTGVRSTEELGVIVASSAAAVLLDARRAVGLLAVGAADGAAAALDMVAPGRGPGHLWKILHVLARARAESSTPLRQVLEGAARVVPSGATALVITPSLEPDWLAGLARLQGQGVGTAAVLVDADSFAVAGEHVPIAVPDAGEGRRASGSALSRAEALRGLLANLRVGAEIVRADTPLALRPPTGRVRRWEFKVLGTGRAVAISTPWGES